MSQILIYPNFYVIENVQEKSYDMNTTLYNWAVWNKVYHRYESHVFKYIDNNIHLPSTIPLGTIQKLYKGRKVEYRLDEYPKPREISFNMKYGSRNELQQECEIFLYDFIKEDTAQKYVGLAPGSGKTFLTWQLISQLKMASMIVVNTTYLAQQWKNEALKHSDLKDKDVVILSGLASVMSEMEKPKKAKVYIAIHRTLGNMISQDLTLINEMNAKLGIGLRVFDEGHLEFTNICHINCVSNVKYTLYLSATPDRTCFEERTIFAKIFKHIPYYNGKHIVNSKYHKILIYKYNSEPSEQELKATDTKFGFSRTVWSKNVYENSSDILKNTIIDIFTKLKLHQREKKIAIILPTIKMIEMFRDVLRKEFPRLTTMEFIGSTPKDKRMEVLKSDIIVTNEKMFATGVDVKDLEIVINYVPIGNLVNIEQTVGRLRNLTSQNKVSIFIDAVDVGYAECERQLTKVRMTYYKRIAKEIRTFQ